MSRGRASPRFWWGQTNVNTDTFFSEAAHPHNNRRRVVRLSHVYMHQQTFEASALQRSSIPDHRLDLGLHEPQKYGSPP